MQEAGEGEKVKVVEIGGGKREREGEEDEREGISGAKGRALKKAREEGTVEEGADFVMFPVSDDEFDGEDDEGEDLEEELEDADEDLESVSSFDEEQAEAGPEFADDSDDDDDGAVASLLVR